MKVTSTFKAEAVDKLYLRIDDPNDEGRIQGVWYKPTRGGFDAVDDDEMVRLEAEYQKMLASGGETNNS